VSTDVSEEYDASIFRFKEKAIQEKSVKADGKQRVVNLVSYFAGVT
jgi:hypothetical protein